MTLKKYVADILGTVIGHNFHQLTDDQLDLKIRYSEDFLRVIGLVDPGLTKVHRETKKNNTLFWIQ
jgi:hypothetical protein